MATYQSEYPSAYRSGGQPAGYSQGRPRIPVKLVLALGIAAVMLLRFCSLKQTNPLTGRTQHISISVEQEVAMGLQAAPEMAEQFGGLNPDAKARGLWMRLGSRLCSRCPTMRRSISLIFICSRI